MSLIKCPECNHDMSSFADKCPNCGFPNIEFKNIKTKEQSNDCKVYNVVFQFVGINNRKEVRSFLEDNMKIDSSLIFKCYLNPPAYIAKAISKQKAESIVYDLTKLGCEVKMVEFNANTEDAIELQKYVVGVRCPQCGSANFTTGSRGFSVWTGFLGAGKTVNRCGKCGHTWQPK